MPENTHKQLKLNPTLIIGIGGSGQKALTHFKETFLNNPVLKQNYGENGEVTIPPIIQLMCIDTDVPEVDHRKASNESLTDADFCKIHVTNAKEIKANLDLPDFNYISNWFPKEIYPYLESIEVGANQLRFLGRFGLFYMMDKVFKMLVDKIKKIIAVDTISPEAMIVPTTDEEGKISPPQINIVGSICGGSGAGMFIDVAYLARMAYYQLKGGEVSPRIRGIQFTADAFAGVPDAAGRLGANTYASLAELYYFMTVEHASLKMKRENAKQIKAFEQRCRFKVDYGPVGKSYENYGPVSSHRVFDNSYLLGTGSLTNGKEYFAIAGEFLFATVASDAARSFISQETNMQPYLARFQAEGNGKQNQCFASFGHKSFWYPAEALKELYACRLARSLAQWLKNSGSNIDINKLVSDFVAKNKRELGLDVESLVMTLKNLTPRRDYWDNPRYHSFTGNPNQGSDEDASTFLLRRIREIENAKVKRAELASDIREMFGRTDGLAAKARETVRQQLIDIICDPQMGVNIALSFMDTLLKSLGNFPRQITTQEAALKARNDKERAEFIRARDALTERLTSFMGFGGTLMEIGALLQMVDLQEEYRIIIKEATDEAGTQFEMFYFALAKEFVLEVIKQIEPLKKQVDVMAGMLSDLEQDGKWSRQEKACLETITAGGGTDQKFIRASIIDELDIQPFYEFLLGKQNPDEIEKDFLRKERIGDNWDRFTNAQGNALETAVWRYSLERVSGMQIGGIESFLQWKGAEYVKNLVKSMIVQSAPLISLNDHAEHIERGQVILLGIPDETEFTKEIMESLRVAKLHACAVPTRNDFEISLIHGVYGIAPYNLSGLPQWHGKYRKNSEQVTCHAVLNNSNFPILWRSYGIIPARSLEQLYLVYTFLRYEYVDSKAKRPGISWNDADTTYELCYNTDDPQPLGNTVPKIFHSLQASAMGGFLINQIYDGIWNSWRPKQQMEFLKKHIPTIAALVEKYEDEIEQEVLKGKGIDSVKDERLAIKRGILTVLADKYNELERVFKDGPSAAVKAAEL